MRIKRYAIIGFWTIPTIAKNSAGEINTRVNHVTYVRNELGANKANRNNNSDGVEFQWEAKEWLTRLIKTGPLMQDNAQSYKSANAKQGGGGSTKYTAYFPDLARRLVSMRGVADDRSYHPDLTRHKHHKSVRIARLTNDVPLWWADSRLEYLVAAMSGGINNPLFRLCLVNRCCGAPLGQIIRTALGIPTGLRICI